MAAPVAGNVRLPLDTGNTGKYKRTQTRTVGADSVHTDYVIVEDPRSVVGSYSVSSGVLTVPAAVHNGTTTGFLWLYNPVGAGIKMQIMKVSLRSQFTALAVDLLPGELRFNRITFTGVNSGTKITPSKRDSNDATAVGEVASSWATAVATLGAAIFGTLYQTMDLVTGGAGHWNPHIDAWEPLREHEEIILRAGEGIVIWHAAAVTTANRRLIINAHWDEFE
jgi:hypothetical protein